MTVAELAMVAETPLKVMSGYNGKVLCCRAFKKEKHEEIGKREVLSVWSEITVANSVYHSFASSTLCVYVCGGQEHEEHIRKLVAKRDG